MTLEWNDSTQPAQELDGTLTEHGHHDQLMQGKSESQAAPESTPPDCGSGFKKLEAEEGGGRERLRGVVPGRVWIPEIWGQEELLKDWVDCSRFDAALVPAGIVSARSALAEEGRRVISNTPAGLG